MGDYYGYLILGIFAFIFIGISVIVSKKFPAEGVDDFVAAGRGIPSALIAASVMVSWVWTTTLMGSAEAGMNFGISGGLNYAWGNAVPFFILIPMVSIYERKCQSAQPLQNLSNSDTIEQHLKYSSCSA